MEIEKIKLAPELGIILQEFDEALKKKEEYELGFNLFSLVSDTYYKENFHSEIIYALLNPDGKHKEGRIFLDCFLDFLKIDKANYIADIQVINEHAIQNQRRIDIIIRSQTHAIIIENKINGANDLENQLVDYYMYCKNNKLVIDSILYLSLDGNKTPDESKWNCDQQTKDEIKTRLKLISAFENKKEEETICHWLKKCMAEAKNWDTIFIIKQYQQLLKSLRGYIMETMALKKYYEWISNTENNHKLEVEQLIKMHNNLILYYPEKLISSISKYTGSENSISNIFTVFGHIEKSNYDLVVKFVSNEECDIWIRDNSEKSKRWSHDDKLKANKTFMSDFDGYDNFWRFKRKDYNLIDDFNTLIKDVENILLLVSNIINNK